MPRNIKKYPYRPHKKPQRVAAVRNERKRDSRRRHTRCYDRNIHQHLQRYHNRNTGCQQAAEGIARIHGNMYSAPYEEQIYNHQRHYPYIPEFFAYDRKYKVILRLWEGRDFSVCRVRVQYRKVPPYRAPEAPVLPDSRRRAYRQTDRESS